MLKELRKYLVVMLFAFATVGLAGGCSTSDRNSEVGVNAGDDADPSGGGGDGGDVSGCPEEDLLDGVQCTLSTLTSDELAGVLAGTPLEGLVQCLDPTANDVVEGPESLVQALLTALQNQDADPAAFQEAATDLQTAIESLGGNVPNALLALSGDQDAIDACTGEGDPSGGDAGGSGLPLDPTALCAIPTLGEQIVTAAGGSCTGEGGTGGSPLDPAALCAVPGIGPVLAEGAGATCDGGGGGDSPLDASQLCAIPGIGAQLAEAAGSSCDGGGTGGDSPIPADQLEPLCAIPTLGPAIVEGAGGACGATGDGSPFDPTALCAIPTLGPAIVEGAGSSCTGGGGTGGDALDPAALCAVPGLGPALAGAAGADCGGGGGGDDPLEQLCGIPEVGPQIVGALGGTCPSTGGDGGGGGPTGTPLDDVIALLSGGGGGAGLPDASALCAIPGIGPVLAGVGGGSC